MSARCADPYMFDPAAGTIGGSRRMPSWGTQQAVFRVENLPPQVTITGLDEGAFVESSSVD